MIGAFGGGEAAEERADGIPRGGDRGAAARRSSALSLAKTCSIGGRQWTSEVRAVRRQEEERGFDGRDRPTHGVTLVRAEIVHDDDVIRCEDRDQELFDIGEEGLAVDRAVDHARGGDRILPEGGDEGGGLPVAARSTPIGAHHVR